MKDTEKRAKEGVNSLPNLKDKPKDLGKWLTKIEKNKELLPSSEKGCWIQAAELINENEDLDEKTSKWIENDLDKNKIKKIIDLTTKINEKEKETIKDLAKTLNDIRTNESKKDTTLSSFSELFEDKEITPTTRHQKIAEFLCEKNHFKTFRETEKIWIYTNPIYEKKGKQLISERLTKKLGDYMSIHKINEITEKVKHMTYTTMGELNPRYIA